MSCRRAGLDEGAVAGLEHDLLVAAVVQQTQAAARVAHVDVAAPLGAEAVRHRLVPGQQRRVDLRVLVDHDWRLLLGVVVVVLLDTIAVVLGADDEAQLAVLLLVGEVGGLVAGLEVLLVGLEPHLQEVDRLRGRVVVLAVHDAAAGRSELNPAALDLLLVVQRVLVLEAARDHVAEDLIVAVRVLAETLAFENGRTRVVSGKPWKVGQRVSG